MQSIPPQLPHENNRAYGAFTAYCRQEGKRSAEKLSFPMGVPRRTLLDWQAKYQWKARAAEFDRAEEGKNGTGKNHEMESIESLSGETILMLNENYKLHRQLRREMQSSIDHEVLRLKNETQGFDEKQKVYLKIDSLLNRMNLSTYRLSGRLLQARRLMEKMLPGTDRQAEKVQNYVKKVQSLTAHEMDVLRYWTSAWPGGGKEMREAILRMRDNLLANPAIDIEREIKRLELTPEQAVIMREIFAA